MPAHTFYTERRERDANRGRWRIVRTGGSSGEPPWTTRSVGPESAYARLETDRPGAALTISATDSYLESRALSPVLVQAMVLLRPAVEKMSQAVQAAERGELLESDLHVQGLRSTFRRLFMCRQIGDGFGAVVDALISSLENNHGRPLDERRLHALHDALAKLSREPFVKFTSAMKTIEELERAGFSTEPPGFEHLADWLTAEGLS